MNQPEQGFPKIKHTTIERCDNEGKSIVVRTSVGAKWLVIAIGPGIGAAVWIVSLVMGLFTNLTMLIIVTMVMLLISGVLLLCIAPVATLEHELTIDKVAGTLTALRKMAWPKSKNHYKIISLGDIADIRAMDYSMTMPAGVHSSSFETSFKTISIVVKRHEDTGEQAPIASRTSDVVKDLTPMPSSARDFVNYRYNGYIIDGLGAWHESDIEALALFLSRQCLVNPDG